MNNSSNAGRRQQQRGFFSGPPGMMAGEKARDFRGSIRRLVGYLGKYIPTITVIMVIAVLAAVLSIVGPKILGKATDEIFTGMMNKITGSGGMDFTRISQILLMMAGFYAFSALLSYLQGFIMAGVTMKISFRLRADLNDKIHLLPFGYFDRSSHGDILSRITNDVDTISQTLSQSVTQIITSATMLVGILVMMISISWQLTLVALLILPLSMCIMIFVVKASQKHFKRQQAYLGDLNGHVEEMLGSHIIVKAFGGEAASVGAFRGHNDALYKASWKANFLSGLMMPITGFVGNIGYVAVCIIGGYFAAQKIITVGDIQAFITYMRSFTQPIAQLANISNVLQQTAAAAERVFEFLDEEEETPDAPGALTVMRQPGDTGKDINGAVEFVNVSFGYNPDKIILNDFSAFAEPGKKIAIVGPTGAGKTTVVKLLMRFYDVNKGLILLDGEDIRSFRRDDLRSVFGMVLQDTWLFNGTITDNIRYGNLGATEEQVREAAAAAQVDHFVRTLPDGYNLELNEEASNISQGQKQLLTIARVILADPKILILDEATSSVDTRTEILIQTAMDNLMHGRTSFIIAHRLSTIRNADLILCMRDGDIVEQGSHTELLERGGFYANLYNSQFENAE